MEALQGMQLHGRPLDMAFAKNRSDRTVLKEDGPEGLEQWKRERLAAKGTEIHTTWLELQNADTPAQNGDKPPKQKPPRPDLRNAPRPKTSPNAPRRAPSLAPPVSLPTSTSHRTRRWCCASCQKIIARTCSRLSSSATLASRNCVWCRVERAWRLRSIRMRLVPLRRKTRWIGLSLVGTRSGLRIRGSKFVMLLGQHRSFCGSLKSDRALVLPIHTLRWSLHQPNQRILERLEDASMTFAESM